ncbi:MAG: RsmE family RNA methyltransferase [Candidatus Chromulinivorax sp.]|nr:RsmE family RNA methyltransferase [Candidatus Chromulinivorax sp.]
MQNKKPTQGTQHQFAFYYADLSSILLEDIDITLVCDDLFHRFKHVVRMQQDDTCTIFNQKERVTFMFAKLEGKNKIRGTWQNRQQNQRLAPEITFILPMLKIDALSDAIYSLAEVGITNIQLVTTHKTQTPYSEKLFDKLHRVAVAAAEQSKVYAFPTILPPVKLQDLLATNLPGDKFHFDVTGVPFAEWYKPACLGEASSRSLVQADQNYYLLVGPEGDLTDDEKSLVKTAGFQSCFLTPTVLRSVRAISLVSGLFRL